MDDTVHDRNAGQESGKVVGGSSYTGSKKSSEQVLATFSI